MSSTLTAVALCAALAFGAAPRLDPPARGTLTVRNETRWLVAVVVDDGDGITPLASVEPSSTRLIREVVVPEQRWRLLWRHEGRTLAVTALQPGSVATSVVVPDEVATSLRGERVPPTP